jgi:hypothetical protein
MMKKPESEPRKTRTALSQCPTGPSRFSRRKRPRNEDSGRRRRLLHRERLSDHAPAAFETPDQLVPNWNSIRIQ